VQLCGSCVRLLGSACKVLVLPSPELLLQNEADFASLAMYVVSDSIKRPDNQGHVVKGNRKVKLSQGNESTRVCVCVSEYDYKLTLLYESSCFSSSEISSVFLCSCSMHVYNIIISYWNWICVSLALHLQVEHLV